ncbi:MAG: hypothetical protein AAFY88_10390 [Acidobacteriota bacterium]
MPGLAWLFLGAVIGAGVLWTARDLWRMALEADRSHPPEWGE